MTDPNPLLGTPLHKTLMSLMEAQNHLGVDVKADYGAAGRLADADAGIADAISAVRGELNRRFTEMRNKRTAKPPPPAPATIELKMPGRGSPPVVFAKTKRGVKELLDWVAGAMNDGGTTILLINAELFNRLAANGFDDEVQALRKAAAAELEPADGD
jgi:hypothetical protein